MIFNNRKKREMLEEKEINKVTIERLLEAIFCEKQLDEDEIDVLLKYYPNEMHKISFKNNLKNNPSAKIGFKI